MKVTVKFVKEYLAEQQKLLMEYIDFDDETVLAKGNPIELIDKRKLPEYTQRLQDIEYAYICKIYNIEYNDDLEFNTLINTIKKFRKEHKCKSLGELISFLQQ